MRRLALVMMFAGGCASAEMGAGNDNRQPDAAVAGVRSDASSDGRPGDAAPSDPCAFSGALATYTFAGETGTQAQTAPTSMASGVTAGPLKRAATVTATSGANSINSTNWPTAAQVDLTKFYSFTLTPPIGCSMSLTTTAIDVKSSGTGPAQGALATSSDNYAAFKTVSTGTPSTVTVGVTASALVEVRVYGFAASSTSGTMRVQGTVTVNGSLQSAQ